MRIDIGAGLLLSSLLLCPLPTANAQPTQTEQTETERLSKTHRQEQAAARWGLTVAEYEKYETAMAGLRGRLSDTHITPIEVLGIEADTPAERRKYAEAWVKLIEADTAKVLAFSNVVNWTCLAKVESVS